MKAAISPWTLAFALVFGLCGVGSALADHGRHPDRSAYDRLDQLAVRLQAESKALYGELRSNSLHDPKLWTATREVGQIQRQAGHLHRVIHSGYGLQHAHRDVQALQKDVHHVEQHLAGYKHFRKHVERMDRLTHQMDDCIHDIEARSLSRNHWKNPGFVPASIGGMGFSIQFGK